MLPIRRRRRMRDWDDMPMAPGRRSRHPIDRWWDADRLRRGEESYPVDVHEDDEAVYVEAELPGFRKEEVLVTLDRELLRIEAERAAQQRDDRRAPQEERHFFHHYEREVVLPAAVDAQEAKAQLRDGVLHLELPKSPQTSRERIPVQ
ncbi:MAG: Hsp20 family protein [Candidatus Eisenbacteria bacterium]|nr:Hsp20 family protein [Candidatus Eisenbacteria bacterium]